jgi:hypothetical protein
MNQHEARQWPEMIAALSRHLPRFEIRTESDACANLIVFLERCYRTRLQIGEQRRLPPARH